MHTDTSASKHTYRVLACGQSLLAANETLLVATSETSRIEGIELRESNFIVVYAVLGQPKCGNKSPIPVSD